MADNIDFSGVFDFESAETGVEEQEIAEPAEVEAEGTEENTEGAEEQEAAEPAREIQSAEDNAAAAAARRRAEREKQEEVQRTADRVRREMIAETEGMIKGLGMVNPYTGKAVHTMDDMKAYVEAISAEQQKQAETKMKESGLSEEDINAMVLSRPEVQQAIKAKERLEALEREAQERKSKQVFDDELALIQKFDPDVKTFEDLINNEHRDKITAMIKRGYRISDAYYLANKDAIMQRNTEMSRQEAMNSVRGKGHMEKSKSRGDGGITVSADVIADFQQLNPGKSVDEIRAFLARDAKRMKK